MKKMLMKLGFYKTIIYRTVTPKDKLQDAINETNTYIEKRNLIKKFLDFVFRTNYAIYLCSGTYCLKKGK